MKILKTNTKSVNFAGMLEGALDLTLNTFVVPQAKGALNNYLLEKYKEKKTAERNKPIIEN